MVVVVPGAPERTPGGGGTWGTRETPGAGSAWSTRETPGGGRTWTTNPMSDAKTSKNYFSALVKATENPIEP